MIFYCINMTSQRQIKLRNSMLDWSLGLQAMSSFIAEFEVLSNMCDSNSKEKFSSDDIFYVILIIRTWKNLWILCMNNLLFTFSSRFNCSPWIKCVILAKWNTIDSSLVGWSTRISIMLVPPEVLVHSRSSSRMAQGKL